MKTLTTLSVIAALAIGAPALAEAPNSQPWYTFKFSSQTCTNSMGNPPQFAEKIRETFQVDPTIDDVTDDSGKVIAVVLKFYKPNDDAPYSVNMFRGKGACEAYAASQRHDASKYQ